MSKSGANHKPTSFGSALRIFAPALLLFIVMACLFWKAFLPDFVIFSNDGPLGVQMEAWIRLPQAFLGQWYDLNTLGVNGGASLPDVSTIIRWILGPLGYAKFMTPISCWFLGVAAYFCFRRSGMAATPSILGGLAAGLTTGFFTNACWGAAPPNIAFGMDFLALGAVAKRDKLAFWIAPALAGMAVGINVMEATDIGALFSMLVAAYVVYQSLIEDGAPIPIRAARGIGRTVLVAAFAVFIAAYAVSALIGSNIRGVIGTKQDTRTKAEHWDFATSWSMPKRETLALMIPNLYGCNVVTPGAANYWGGLGTDPEWDRYFASDKTGPPPSPNQHFLRHTGRGIYLGTLVILIGLWAVVQSFRSKDSVFTPMERKLVWFWIFVAVVSLLFAYGRFAPFYRLIYNLPYFSTIRNPDKFLHLVTFASIILFAYGAHGLHRRYVDVPLVAAPNGRLKSWWTKAGSFDRRWVVGSLVMVFLACVGWAAYAAMRGHVENYLVELQRASALGSGNVLDGKALNDAQQLAAAQVSLSLQQVGWFILFLVAGSGLMLMILSGAFAGRRAVWAGVLLGIVVVGDLGRANLPYIVFWNYKDKYEVGDPEPVIKFLADKPYEHRVAYSLPTPPFMTPPELGSFQTLYGLEWTQQLFPFYNIQTLDIVQMPRMPVDLETFRDAMLPGITNEQGRSKLDEATFYRVGRNWELTATRYLVGPAPLVQAMNAQFDSVPGRFRVIQRFDLGPRPGVARPVQYSQVEATPSNDPNAPYALIEFTGALPRASLFSQWQVNTNDDAVLQQLASRTFDPAKLVFVASAIPAVKAGDTNQTAEAVKFVSYEPADIKLAATPTSPSVLMLCDKYDPDWQVWVDGKRGEVIRCDYLLRGVYLEPGPHQVEFKFRPDINMFYVEMAAILFGVCLLGYVIATNRRPYSGEQSSTGQGPK